jgi:acetylornithine/succinyldiaminopimelate/putrescine aminotransferase
MLEIERAEGVWLFDTDGGKYLDLISGVSVSNIGHRHKKVVEAIRNQTERYLHLMVYGEIVQSPQVEYAADLVKLLPDTLSSVYFVNSGSEAVEGAIKLAKRFTGRPGVVAFKNGYHGSTIGALSIQGDEKYKSAFRPLMPSVDFAIFNNPESLDIIDYNTAAVVIEPVQGEGGVILPENGFLKLVRERCDETGSLLIFDEIQTGFGRVGTLFAIDKYGVKPDILLLAKALGGGMPLGAFISSYEIMSSLSNNPILGHITTFGGHPVSCAAGHAALKVVLSEKLHQVANKSGERFKSKLKHPLIKTVRGEGLFIAVELVSEELIHLFIRKGIKNGLLLDYFLFNSLAFRIAPPLNITDKEIDFASEIILKTLDQL